MSKRYQSYSTGQIHEMDPSPSMQALRDLPASSAPSSPKQSKRTKKNSGNGGRSIPMPPFNPTPTRSTGMSFWEERRSMIPQATRVGEEVANRINNMVGRWTKPDVDSPRIAISPWSGTSIKNCVYRAGGVPVEITSNTELSVLDECTALVIPGGIDVDPALYHEAMNGTAGFNRDRDEFEMALIRYAMKQKMAILGICRGHQLLNVFFGGSLVQHMSPGHDFKHPVRIAADSVLSYIGEDIVVNSLHHQCVKELGKNMRPIAWSREGEVEAIQHEKRQFVVGVQWHPEMSLTPRFGREMDKLWKRLVKVAEAKKKAKLALAEKPNEEA